MSTLKSSNENLILNADGATSDVEIQSNGSTKLATTYTGVDVTGDIELTGNLIIDNGSPNIIYETGPTHYNWRAGAQESVTGSWEIASGNVDDDASNDIWSAKILVKQNGDVHAEGDVIAYSTTISDERLKTDIKPIENALDKVSQLNGYTFTYTADGKESAGLIAQEVEKVLPSAVSEKELPLKTDDGETYKVLQYDQTIGLLVEAVKELQARVEELEVK